MRHFLPFAKLFATMRPGRCTRPPLVGSAPALRVQEPRNLVRAATGGTVTLDDVLFNKKMAYISRATLDSERHWTPQDLGTGSIAWVPKHLRGYRGEQSSTYPPATRHRRALAKWGPFMHESSGSLSSSPRSIAHSAHSAHYGRKRSQAVGRRGSHAVGRRRAVYNYEACLHRRWTAAAAAAAVNGWTPAGKRPALITGGTDNPWTWLILLLTTSRVKVVAGSMPRF